MAAYAYKGTTSGIGHFEVLMLGRQFGLQHIRKMATGEKIAELANNGNEKAIAVCENNSKYFEKI